MIRGGDSTIEATRSARCRCVLGDRDRCRAEVSPDEPFCPSCETRHPGMPRAWVGVVPLPIGVEA